MYPSEMRAKLMLRLPDDAKAFIAREAERNGSSQNSEIVRAIRERMDRVAAGTSPGKANPAAEANTSACNAG